MATLQDQKPKDTYKDLLQRANTNTGVDATLRVVSGGNGVNTPLYLATEKVKIKPTTDSTTVFEVHDKDGNVMFTVDTTNNKIIAASGVTWEGNGANLTGITGATGGISNDDATNIVADADGDGTGDITFTINVTDVVKLKNDGSGTGGILEVVETTTHTTPDAGFVGISAENNNLVTIDEDGVKGIVLTSNTQVNPSFVSFDGTDDYYSVSTNTNLLSGTYFSYAVTFDNAFANTSDKTIFSLSNSVSVYVRFTRTSTASGFRVEIRGNETKDLAITIADNNKHQIVFVKDGTSGKLYLDGTLLTSATLLETYTLTSYFLTIGSHNANTSYVWDGNIYNVKLYNRALSASEVTSLYNYGHPELYEVPYADRGASQTELVTNGSFDIDTDWTKGTGWTISDGKAHSNGTINQSLQQSFSWVAGAKYLVTFDVDTASGGTFSMRVRGYNSETILNVSDTGSYSVVYTPTGSGGLFQLTILGDNTATNIDIDNVSVIRIGEVASYEADNATSYSWIDNSGNNLHAQGSGSPTAVRSEKIKTITQFKGSVTGNTTLTSVVPKGYMLREIIVSSDAAYTLNVGSSVSGGTDVINASSIVSGLNTITVNKMFSLTADQTLYLQSADWNSSTNTVYLKLEKL